MATIYKTESGLNMKVLSDSERKQAWKELDEDISVIGKDIALFTPRDNLKYFIDKEVSASFEKYTLTIRANGKTFEVKCNICNEQSKT